MALLQKDFLPLDLQPILQQQGFSGCVLVQSAQPENENIFLLEQAQAHSFIKGVVGWLDFMAEDVSEKLAYYNSYQKIKGFRYILQGNPNPAIMLRPEFKRGIRQLQIYGYTYDILVYPNQLPYISALVATFPDQLFVVDHLAKPPIKSGKIQDWQRSIEALAQYPNVYCKLSGMVTEADWHNWQYQDFVPYLDVVVAAFGTDRILYGSDWPVCLVAATYAETLGIVQTYFAQFSKTEQAAFFGGNAVKFYNLF